MSEKALDQWSGFFLIVVAAVLAGIGTNNVWIGVSVFAGLKAVCHTIEYSLKRAS